jgi:hypothetical protein
MYHRRFLKCRCLAVIAFSNTNECVTIFILQKNLELKAYERVTLEKLTPRAHPQLATAEKFFFPERRPAQSRSMVDTSA